MPQPIFEELSGVVNGTNAIFFFSAPYTPGTTAIYLNGQLLTSSAPPWSESNPSLGEITITAAECIPRVDDVIAGFALDTSAIVPETLIEDVIGVLADETDALAGVLAEPLALAGVLADDGALAGVIADGLTLTGIAEDLDSVTGIAEDC